MFWIFISAVSIVFASKSLGDSLTTKISFTTDTESKIANNLIKKSFPEANEEKEIVIIKSDKLEIGDPVFQEFARKIYDDIIGLGSNVVKNGVSYFQTNDGSFVSSDKHIILMYFTLAGVEKDKKKNVDILHSTLDKDNKKENQFQVLITGKATLDEDFQELAEKDLKKGELYGIPIAIVITLLVFGNITSIIIPFLLTVFSIAAAIGTTTIVGQVSDLSFFIVNMITMMGLAVGIDYSLFIVSRYREERAKGLGKTEAIIKTGGTANRSVFFSGMIVIFALIGLIFVPNTFFQSLSVGAILVVIATISASLSFLPTILSIIGDKINSFKPGENSSRENSSGSKFWNWAAKIVMKHPIASLILSSALLISAALPYSDIQLGNAGSGELPDNLKSKEAYTILEKNFSASQTESLQIVIDGKVDSEEIKDGTEQLEGLLKKDSDFGNPTPILSKEGDLTLLNLPFSANPSSNEATEAVKRLRDEYILEAFPQNKNKVYVTGNRAEIADFIDLMNEYNLPIFSFVLGLSFILLTIIFRSIVVPIKAVLMNLLSVGAAYGILVLVFQKGVGAEFFGFQKVDAIESWLPIFLFCLLFGLSMDYHIFLLSRIREHFDKTKDNSESVAFGLRTTGRIITGAAMIMVTVFIAFASGDLVPLQQLGLGVAVSIFLDATIVRSILVPAAMKLLGKTNWYLPKFLQWLPRLNMEGN